MKNAPASEKSVYKCKHIWTIYLSALEGSGEGEKKKKTYQNMKARHPFCLESELTETDRPRADDRWPDVGGGWGVRGSQKNGNFTLKLFRV